MLVRLIAAGGLVQKALVDESVAVVVEAVADLHGVADVACAPGPAAARGGEAELVACAPLQGAGPGGAGVGGVAQTGVVGGLALLPPQVCLALIAGGTAAAVHRPRAAVPPAEDFVAVVNAAASGHDTVSVCHTRVAEGVG